MNRIKGIFTSAVAMMIVAITLAPLSVKGVGTWTRLARQAPDAVELMLLMPDGTVMVASQPGSSYGQGWFKLTPDSHGSYINGTWTTLASMRYTRLYYASAVLRDGRVFIAGGEYGTGGNTAEVYDPKNNTWTEVGPVPSGQGKFSDNISKMLPNGDLMIAPVVPAVLYGTVIFHPDSNTLTTGPRLLRNQNEASWVKLPDDSIITIDAFGTRSERYIPSLNKWIDDAVVPVPIYNSISELGPAFLLPNGKAFFIGGTSHTAIYTPSGTTNMGSWAAGADIPGGHGVSDGAGAMMVNGKVLCGVGSTTNYDAPTWFYEYDYRSNSFTAVNGPNGLTEPVPPYYIAMLDLPDGTVLMSRFSKQIYVYQPDGSPLASGKPTITGITRNVDKSYHLTGTLLNGISEGACYGDDIQMDSNYPLIRLRDAAGNVFYARSYNWSSTGVMTGNRPVSTEFSVSTNLAAGVYSLVAVANGISSDPVSFFIGTLAITAQPQNKTVLDGQLTAFSVAVAGDAPISIQWRKDNTDIPGATNSTYSLFPAHLGDAGGYSAFVTNVTGAVTSSVATLVVVPTVPLDYALNYSNFLWGAQNPAAVWYGQTNVSHDGVASAQTFLMTNGQQAALGTTVTGPATLGFWCKVSSQANSDYLSFSINGTNQLTLSGEVDWEQHMYYLPAGSVDLVWTYTKDGAGSAGQDAAWLDQISFVTGGTGPFITAQPSDQNSLGGSPVLFSVSANGTPNLSYQWRFNQSPIAGATGSSLSIAAPASGQMGAYSVLITNAFGTIASSNALLTVVPIIAVGDNSVGQRNVPAATSNAIAVAAGSWHNLALKADGKVVAWGANNNGQCDVPANLSDVVEVAAGGYHSLALKANGTVVGWGADFDGQTTPPPFANVVAIAAGTWHSLALLADGTVQGWGDDSSGQTDVPAGLGNVIRIAAGGNHSVALLADGTVVAWGENINSQGFYVGQSVVPSDLGKATAIGAGDFHSLAVKLNGAFAGWGDDSQGQTDLPGGLGAVTALAGGGGHTVVLKGNGFAAAWGNNLNGQCNVPIAVSNVIGVAAGSAHSLLLLGTPAGNPVILSASHSGGQFTVVVQTASGKSYSLEYKDSLSTSTWTGLPAVQGNGALKVLTDPNATVAQRFYRVRQF